MIRGIVPVYAKKLLRVFGEKMFDVIEAEPHRLQKVDEHHSRLRFEMDAKRVPFAQLPVAAIGGKALCVRSECVMGISTTAHCVCAVLFPRQLTMTTQKFLRNGCVMKNGLITQIMMASWHHRRTAL
jgi:hypothetical protein